MVTLKAAGFKESSKEPFSSVAAGETLALASLLPGAAGAGFCDVGPVRASGIGMIDEFQDW